MVNMADIVNDIYYRLDDNANDDTDFGDDDNTAAVIPTAVVDFTGDISYYTLPVTHEQRAKITWSWSEPIMYDEDSNPIDVDDPEVQDDFDFDPVVAYMFRTSETAYVSITSLNIITQDHKLERDVTGYVYPITKSGLTGPVATFIAHVTKDTTPPPTPATPILTSEMGTVTATYNGKDNTGVDMPPDVNLLHVYGGTINPPTAEVGSLLGPGQLPIEATVGLNYYVRFRAEDHAGNFSPYSATASIVVKSVLDDTGLEEALANRSRVIQSNTMPPGSNYQVNDVWFDTDDGNKIYFWKGLPTGWQPQGLGTSALSGQAVTAEKLAQAINDEIASKASQAYVQSRGTDLVTNGTGLLGTNYNFPSSTFNSADSPIGGGSFVYNPGPQTRTTQELIPVDLDKRYILSAAVRQLGTSNVGRVYIGLLPIDIDKLELNPTMYMFQANTTTTLAVTLSPGATKIVLTSAANWNNAAGASTHLRSLIAWNYVDGQGKAWPTETYSRNFWNNLWNDGAVVGNEITLRVPWTGPTIPVGTSVSNGSAGSNYMYTTASNALIPKQWTTFKSAPIGGPLPGSTSTGRISAYSNFPPGTAYVKVVILLLSNTNDATSQLALASVSLSDAAVAGFKNSVAYSSVAPTSEGRIVGDTWFNTSQDNRIYYWSGSGWVAQQFGPDSIATNAITEAKILGSAVTTTKIADNAITTPKIVAGSITAASGIIANAAIGNAQIINGSITNVKIQDATIQYGKIASVDAATISTGFLSADRIQAKTLAADKIAAGAIAVGGDLIANGAIVGNHIAALTITGAKIAGDTITGDKIQANEIVANHLTTGAVTANKIASGAIDGKIITGAIIQTIVTANRGIILDTNSLRAYNSSGVATLTINASTGAISMLGSLTSGSTITGATITGGVINGTTINSEDGLVVAVDGSIRFNSGASFGRIYSDSSGYIHISGGMVYIDSAIGTSIGNRLVSGTNALGNTAISMSTTTSSSNVYSSGNSSALLRVTSLRKYKKLISDNITDDFLMMKPKTWYDKSQIEEAGLDSETVTEKECIKAGLRRIAGFIAEEIEEVNPLYATYYESDLTGVAYDRLTVAIHKTLTNMNNRLLALESAK